METAEKAIDDNFGGDGSEPSSEAAPGSGALGAPVSVVPATPTWRLQRFSNAYMLVGVALWAAGVQRLSKRGG